MPLSCDLKSQKHERLIGAITVRWTRLEGSIQRMLWAMAGLDSRTGLCISQHMSFESLKNAILTITHETPAYVEHYDSTKNILAKADSLRVQRNYQVHALWGFILGEGAPEIVQANEVTGLVIKARGKLSSTIIHTTIEAIEEIMEEIEKCNDEICDFTQKTFGGVKAPSDYT